MSAKLQTEARNERDEWEGPAIYKLEPVEEPKRYVKLNGDESVTVRYLNLISQSSAKSGPQWY
jgi:hypothetical protein